MAFSEEIIQKVWEKGTAVPGVDSNLYRKDQCGAWIFRKHHGDRNSIYGWEADHITPVSQGGSDALSNLRPLQWQNNMSKLNGRLVCVVVSSGNKNIKT